MKNLKAKLSAGALAIGLVISLAVQAPIAAGQGNNVLEFNTMAGVTGPFVGTAIPANPIRGINGGGLPWRIDEGNGELQGNGHLEVQVHGLVLAAGPKAGTNPVANFKAIVSCLSITNGSATTVNVSTGLFPATSTGDAHIEASVSLPSPCLAPIVFVTSPGGAWFAVTGQ